MVTLSDLLYLKCARYSAVVYVLNMTDNLSKMFYLIQVASFSRV